MQQEQAESLREGLNTFRMYANECVKENKHQRYTYFSSCRVSLVVTVCG